MAGGRSKTKSQRLVKTYFDHVEGPRWECKVCQRVYKKSGSGWTNLMSHILSKHPDHETILEKLESKSQQSRQTEIIEFVLPPKSRNIFGWLEYIIFGMKSFQCVETRM